MFNSEDICGGKVEQRMEGYDEVINSSNITSFSYVCGDYCNHNNFGFSLYCKIEDNKLCVTSCGGNYRNRDGTYFRLKYYLDDFSFLKRLNDLIVKKELSRNNGYTYYGYGLPAGLGDTLNVEYDSGEKLYKSSNQGPIISDDARSAIYDLFHELAIENGLDFNSEKSTERLYDDADVDFLQGAWEGTHFGSKVRVEFTGNNIKIYIDGKLTDDTEFNIFEGNIRENKLVEENPEKITEHSYKDFEGISCIRKKNEILLTAYFMKNSYSTCDLLRQKS